MKPGDEVIYALHVPNVTDAVAHDAATRILTQHGIAERHHVLHDDHISIPRLYTRWRGNTEEAEWQRAIKEALPGTIIDVQPWQPAPGYPKGEVLL